MPPFLLFSQRSCVNDVDRVILVHHKNYLEQAASTASAPDQPFVFLDLSWIGTTCDTDHPFRFFGRNAMFSDVLYVPVIPAEVMNLLCKKISVRSTVKHNVGCRAESERKGIAAR
jgi:hypothetical protein